MSSDLRTIARDGYLAEKVVIVDGQPGCGKTMLSPIVAALERVELLTYAYELEYMCSLHALGKISPDACVSLVKMFVDLKLYNLMMGRETNCRPADQSSIFRDIAPWRYLRRMFLPGDSAVPPRIRSERPILHLTTHNMTPYSEPVFQALGNRVVFLEVVRHPLYMVKQQMLNMDILLGQAKDFTIYFLYRDAVLPYFVQGWEDLFLQANAMEKAIFSIEHLHRLTEQRKVTLQEHQAQIITIPFEPFVLNPEPYLEKITQALGTRVTAATRRMMRKQKVPRRLVAEGVDIPVYRRCGWQPPKQGTTENEEYELRRRFAAGRAGDKAMAVLDRLCDEYEEKYLGGRKRTGSSYV